MRIYLNVLNIDDENWETFCIAYLGGQRNPFVNYVFLMLDKFYHTLFKYFIIYEFNIFLKR